MSAGFMLFWAGIGFCLAGVVSAIFAVRRIFLRRRMQGIILFVSAAGSLAIGMLGIWGANRMPYLQLMPVCSLRLRVIAGSIDDYERKFKRRPSSLQELVKSELITSKGLLCPLAWTDGNKPWDVAAAPSDYSYVPEVVAGDPGSWIVAFDNGDHHGDGTRTIVCRDGSTQVLGSEEFGRRLDQFVAEFTAARKRPPRIVN